MYPGVSDLLNDLFGTHFSFSFPPMFGTLVAISFLFAAWTLGKELRRKESLGILKPMTERVVKGLPASVGELAWHGLYGFIIGFKIVYAILNYELFFANPQKIILSLKGNWIAGIGCALLFAWFRYREKEKQKLKEVVVSNELVYPHQLVSEFTVVAAIGGIIGAKLFHQFEYWDEFIKDPIGNLFSGSGLTMYGGLIIGAIAVLWYGKKKKYSALGSMRCKCTGINARLWCRPAWLSACRRW
jgi:prolipoprotein diacylglyceryltransferase